MNISREEIKTKKNRMRMAATWIARAHTLLWTLRAFINFILDDKSNGQALCYRKLNKFYNYYLYRIDPFFCCFRIGWRSLTFTFILSAAQQWTRAAGTQTRANAGYLSSVDRMRIDDQIENAIERVRGVRVSAQQMGMRMRISSRQRTDKNLFARCHVNSVPFLYNIVSLE